MSSAAHGVAAAGLLMGLVRDDSDILGIVLALGTLLEKSTLR